MRKLKGLILVAFMALGTMSFTNSLDSPPDPCLGYAIAAVANEEANFGPMDYQEHLEAFDWYYDYCDENRNPGGSAVVLPSITVED